MAVTVQMPFTSAVTERYQDAFVDSSIENGATIIQFDLRQHDFHDDLGTQATICWRKDSYHVDVHELSTFHNPIIYRFIVAQGCYVDDQNQRRYFTPAIQGVSTSQHMSHSVIRLACYLAVVCRVSLRHLALLFSVLFLILITKSSIKRWIDDIGVQLPPPEEMLRQLLALAPATECHLDGYYPLGTDHCVMVVKDEHDRILITHEAASENGDDARQFLQRCKDLGLNVTAAFSDYSQSFTEAIKAVFPHARFQADHFHTVKNIWGHLKKSLLSYRRQIKESGAEKKDEQLLALAKQLWKLRWSLLKKPGNLSVEEKQALAELAREDAGFVQSFRHIIRQLVNIFDHAHSEALAKLRLQQLRQDIHALEDHHLEKIPQFFDDHWDQALRYLRKKGMGKHRRGSNSESGMRLLRRLEKNHDGIRSAATRQHYIQIYQAMKYLSLDVADFIEKGP
ncbi:MAG TPA: transposase, partial [Candidatus Angelobacter sp.]|nr:transposase [Candidatus Angelobacter sp.]